MSFSLLQARGNSYFFSSRCSIGAYVKNNQVVLIDSGLDKSTAQAIEKELDRKGLRITAIINTHHHADHCGGNHYFQNKFPHISIIASAWEKSFIEQPLMEALCFCSGAAPFKDAHSKFLKAESSVVTQVIAPYQDQTITFMDEPLRIITLPGHTPGMVGVITPDNILYCGDAFFGDDTLEKHGMLFYTNIYDTLQTFKKLEQLSVEGCVFYHGGFLSDVPDRARRHYAKIEQTAQYILDFIKQQATVADTQVIMYCMQSFGIPDTMMQFLLTRSCVSAYLSYLEQLGQITLMVKQGSLVVIPV